MTGHPYSTLSPKQSAIVRTVTRYGQISSSQVRRLHYPGDHRGPYVICSGHLKKLSERGLIRRLPYKLNGFRRGSGEFVYAPPPPASNARDISLHKLDITELMVRLREYIPSSELVGIDDRDVNQMRIHFDPEPWAHTTYGGHKVTPDAYVKLPGRHYWIEVDRSSESPSVISAKMNRYLSAFDGSAVPEGEPRKVFPQILWLAHDPDRVRTLEREAKKKPEPGLFRCLLFDHAVSVIFDEGR